LQAFSLLVDGEEKENVQKNVLYPEPNRGGSIKNQPIEEEKIYSALSEFPWSPSERSNPKKIYQPISVECLDLSVLIGPKRVARGLAGCPSEVESVFSREKNGKISQTKYRARTRCAFLIGWKSCHVSETNRPAFRLPTLEWCGAILLVTIHPPSHGRIGERHTSFVPLFVLSPASGNNSVALLFFGCGSGPIKKQPMMLGSIIRLANHTTECSEVSNLAWAQIKTARGLVPGHPSPRPKPSPHTDCEKLCLAPQAGQSNPKRNKNSVHTPKKGNKTKIK
jgi:hypothetical protein